MNIRELLLLHAYQIPGATLSVQSESLTQSHPVTEHESEPVLPQQCSLLNHYPTWLHSALYEH